MDITMIKHGTQAVSMDGFWIHVDPLADYDPRTDYTQFPKADVILVTHEHGDHLDTGAIRTLSKPGTLILANRKNQEQIGNGEAMASGESRQVSTDILIEAVAAYNITNYCEKFHPRGQGNGYVLNMDGLRIYVAGDTEDIPEMEEIGDVDVLFLPVN